MAKNPFHVFKTQTGRGNYKREEGAGNYDNMDDYNVVDSVALNAGTIQHTPANAKDIANKEYADSLVGGVSQTVFDDHSGAASIHFLSGAMWADIDINTASGAEILDIANVNTASGAEILDIANANTASGAALFDDAVVLSGAVVANTASGAAIFDDHTDLSGAYYTHAADSSDPHGVALTQTSAVITNLTGANILNTGDHNTSGAAYVVGMITSEAATPPAASGFPMGTVFYQYTP